MNLDWQSIAYKLKFQLGDRTFFSPCLQLHGAQFSLIDLLKHDEWHFVPESDLPRSLDGYIIRSAPVGNVSEPLTKVGGYLRYVVARYPRHYIDLAGSFNEYVQNQFSAKTRGTLQRKVRKLAERSGGNVQWRAYRTVGELEAFHPLAMSVSEQTYQQQLLANGLPTGTAFLNEMKELARGDNARGYLLFVDEAPVAYMYLPAVDGILSYAYLGFAPTFRDWSVGTVLHWFALKDLFGEARFRYLDLTEGDGEHKRLFATGKVACLSVLLLRDSFRHRLLLRAHFLTNRFSELVGHWFDGLGLKSRIRRITRYGMRGLWARNS